MACIDFGLTSFCSQVSNIAVAHGNAQAFLTWQIAGYNHPAFGGCSSANWPNGGWFAGRVNAWTNTLAGVTGVAYRRQLIAKIDWANCMLDTCCGQPNGPVAYGCMDDGTKGNDYINNQGTYANPQYGSVLPLDAQGNPQPALNYYAGSDQDNGNCIYVQPVHGCKDPNASNYDPNADMDCGQHVVSDFSIGYTNFQGIQPSGSWTPYGDTSCCTYAPTGCETSIDYNYRYNGPGAIGGVGGVSWFGADRTSYPWYQGGNPAQNLIGAPFLYLYFTVFDVRLNKAHPNYNPGSSIYSNGPHNPLTPPYNWYGTNPLYPTGFPSNPYKITIYDLEEQLVGSWTYSDVYGIGSCNPTDDCYFYVKLGNPTPDPGTPTLYDCGSITQPTPLVHQVFTTNNCTQVYYPGTYPYYILVENIATQEIMTSPIGNGVGNTANLTDYAGTGVNMRFIDNTCSSITPIQDFQYHKVCCSGATSNGCHFFRWLAELSPTHPSFVNVTCDLGNITPLMEKQLYTDCVAASLVCTPSSSLKLNLINESQTCIAQNIVVKGVYNNDENQTVEIMREDNVLLNTEEGEKQTVLTFMDSLTLDSTKNIFNITFKTKSGYYYSKSPSLTMNFPGMENYKIKVESESKNARGYVIEKTFNINYKNTGFDVFESDSHNIMFTTKIAKEVDISTKVKEITALRIDTSSVDSSGESKNISVVGTPGSTFSLTIKDKNGRNILPYSSRTTKTIKTAISASNTLELNNAIGLEVGMVVLNGQRRNVKITGISDPVKTNVDAINETSTTYISISSHLTFSADASITFAKEIDITEVAIPGSGIYSFIQKFPPLEKFKRTLKTAASSTTSLTLDYTKDLENDMRITDTGGLVDGNNPTIGLTKLSTTVGVLADGVTIKVSDAQTIADETELTFEMPDNRYDITLYPLMAILGDDIPRYSSDDCDTLPTYSIYQYIDPIVEIAPANSALSNVTTTGTVTFTGRANRNAGTNGDITISMTATKSDGNLATSRAPRFSSVDSESSDFSNTLNTVTKRVREGDCNDRDIVHLNNIAGIRVGMIITGGGININKTITVKSITGTAVKLSEKQTIRKDDMLTFSSMFNMHISSLTTTLSPNGGLATGICTIAGTGKITTFGIDSFTSTFNFDNFLSIPG